MKTKPTAVQLAALQDYAARHGDDWKEKLSAVWFNGKYDWDRDDAASLQQLRNTLGPEWLAGFTLAPPAAVRVKVERTCPRCHARLYHFGNVRGLKNRIACANCSHEWQGRITKDEQ